MFYGKKGKNRELQSAQIELRETVFSNWMDNSKLRVNNYFDFVK